jgi:hypothetical protein
MDECRDGRSANDAPAAPTPSSPSLAPASDPAGSGGRTPSSSALSVPLGTAAPEPAPVSALASPAASTPPPTTLSTTLSPTLPVPPLKSLSNDPTRVSQALPSAGGTSQSAGVPAREEDASEPPAWAGPPPWLPSLPSPWELARLPWAPSGATWRRLTRGRGRGRGGHQNKQNQTWQGSTTHQGRTTGAPRLGVAPAWKTAGTAAQKLPRHCRRTIRTRHTHTHGCAGRAPYLAVPSGARKLAQKHGLEAEHGGACDLGPNPQQRLLRRLRQFLHKHRNTHTHIHTLRRKDQKRLRLRGHQHVLTRAMHDG